MREMKNYLTLAGGLAMLTRDRAVDVVRRVAAHGGNAATGSVHWVAEDLVSTTRGNREALIGLIRYEVDRALGRMGLASADEVAALRARVRTLEAHMRATQHEADLTATASGP